MAKLYDCSLLFPRTSPWLSTLPTVNLCIVPTIFPLFSSSSDDGAFTSHLLRVSFTLTAAVSHYQRLYLPLKLQSITVLSHPWNQVTILSWGLSILLQRAKADSINNLENFVDLIKMRLLLHYVTVTLSIHCYSLSSQRHCWSSSWGFSYVSYHPSVSVWNFQI